MSCYGFAFVWWEVCKICWFFARWTLNIAVTCRVQKLQTVTQAHCADEAEDGNFWKPWGHGRILNLTWSGFTWALVVGVLQTVCSRWSCCHLFVRAESARGGGSSWPCYEWAALCWLLCAVIGKKAATQPHWHSPVASQESGIFSFDSLMMNVFPVVMREESIMQPPGFQCGSAASGLQFFFRLSLELLQSMKNSHHELRHELYLLYWLCAVSLTISFRSGVCHFCKSALQAILLNCFCYFNFSVYIRENWCLKVIRIWHIFLFLDESLKFCNCS